MAAPLFGFSTLSGTPVTTFLGLGDVPNSYAGHSLQGVRVNAGETALEFASLTTTFVSLTDGPGAFSGNALKYVRVNAGTTALEYQTFPTLVTAFTQLSDVPASYTGNANKVLACNSGETGLTFLSTTFSDLTTILTPFLRIYWPVSNGITTPTGHVGYNPNFSGTAGIGAFSTTNLLTSSARVTITTAAAINTTAGIRVPDATGKVVWRGNATGLGGFKFRARFGTATATANQRLFVGLSTATAAADFSASGNPSSFTNLVGFSYDSAGTQISTITNDNSGTATTSALGASYPVDSTTVYEVTLQAAPNASSIDWTIANLSTGTSTSGTFSSDLPQNSVALAPYLWCNTGATATAVTPVYMFIYLATYG